MQKILTIFDRDWDGNRGVVDQPSDGMYLDFSRLNEGIATEKFDGMNVRITMRSGICVRLEKRRNPSKLQKQKGITDPWYVDADEFDPQDKHLFSAIRECCLETTPDGEWSAEAIGPKIQGDPLDLGRYLIIMFTNLTLQKCISFDDAPITFDGLKEWLPNQKSHYSDCPIEGIVWHMPDGKMFKIKTKDFK